MYEYKIGPVTVEDIVNTIYIKDYPNCIINGTNKDCRSNPISLKSLYNNIGNPKNALKKLPDIDQLTVILMGDRVTVNALDYMTKINNSNSYIYRVSKKKQIKIVVRVLTYKQYIEALDSQFNIHWAHANDLNNELKNLSTVAPSRGFTKVNSITGQTEVINNNSLLPL